MTKKARLSRGGIMAEQGNTKKQKKESKSVCLVSGRSMCMDGVMRWQRQGDILGRQ